jgi:hypothetical protein
LIVSIFLLDLWTPLGIAVWLLYVIPMGYAVRYLQHERSTYVTVSLVAGGLTVLVLLGWFFSPTGSSEIDQAQALFNRGLGILAIWVIAMLLAWLSNRMRSLKEMEAVMQRRLNEKELRIKQALDAGGIAAVEWDLRKGSVRWAGHHDSLTGQGMNPFVESFGEFQQRVYEEDRNTCAKRSIGRCASGLILACNTGSTRRKINCLSWPRMDDSSIAGLNRFAWSASVLT